MRPADRSGTPTLAEVVQTAARASDPDGLEDGVAALVQRFEDSDEPVTAPRDVSETLAEAAGAADPEGEDPAVVMTVAVATYLAYRRDELDSDRDDLLRLAARAEFDGAPPEHVSTWLTDQGVTV
ncbi:MAG TPA: hypothetical protein VK307_05115 [Thermoleophilaceae bacterium]|nr:hypothetical protein [Thermoleophilaceae bacterium]